MNKKEQIQNLIKAKYGSRASMDTELPELVDKIMRLIEQEQVPVEEKEYEILSVRMIDRGKNVHKENIYKVRNGVLRNLDDDAWCRSEQIEHTLWNEGIHEIYSVKRLSDDQVFTIGDRIVTSYNTTGIQPMVIEKIEIDNSAAGGIKFSINAEREKISIRIAKPYVEPVEKKMSADEMIYRISDAIGDDAPEKVVDRIIKIVEQYQKPIQIQEKKEVLLTTEDGIQVTDRESLVYGYSIHNGITQTMNAFTAGFLMPDIWKVFSTEEARQEWIEYNKECLSHKEIVEQVLEKVETARGIYAVDSVVMEILKQALSSYVMDKLKTKQ